MEVAPGVSLYVEESGNPNGIPAVFFHGGPGIEYRTTDLNWFDPEKYRIIAFQQRGTMKCVPSAFDFNIPSLVFKDVTIQTIAQDIEVLRNHLRIDKWLVFGGSWGSALSIFYGEEYPERCLGLVVRGIFLASHRENQLFLDGEKHKRQHGANWNQEALDYLVDYARQKGFDVSLDNTPDIYAAYRTLCVERDDRDAQRIWAAFEEYVDDPTDKALFDRIPKGETTPLERSIGIWETLLMDSVSRTYDLLASERLEKLRGVPIQVVQGERDNLCHPDIAKGLVEGLKSAGCEVKFDLVEGGSHSPYHPGMTNALVRATDTFAAKGSF